MAWFVDARLEDCRRVILATQHYLPGDFKARAIHEGRVFSTAIIVHAHPVLGGGGNQTVRHPASKPDEACLLRLQVAASNSAGALYKAAAIFADGATDWI